MTRSVVGARRPKAKPLSRYTVLTNISPSCAASAGIAVEVTISRTRLVGRSKPGLSASETADRPPSAPTRRSISPLNSGACSRNRTA